MNPIYLYLSHIKGEDSIDLGGGGVGGGRLTQEFMRLTLQALQESFALVEVAVENNGFIPTQVDYFLIILVKRFLCI